MKYNDISLPYPVLGVNDDIFPLLEDDYIQIGSPIKTAKDYVVDVKLLHQNSVTATSSWANGCSSSETRSAQY